MKLRFPVAGLFLFLALSCSPRGEEIVRTGDGKAVRLQVISAEIVRVSVSPDGRFRDRESLSVLPEKERPSKAGRPRYRVSSSGETVRLETDSLYAEVSRSDGTVSFHRHDGTPLALDGTASFSPMEVEGKEG